MPGRNIVARPWPNDFNIMQHPQMLREKFISSSGQTQHIQTLSGATCCVRLATVLRHVGCCWLKFENGQIFDPTFVNVAWCCSRLARFVQQCCARACALVRLSTRNRVAKRMSKNPTTDRVHGLPYGRVHGLPLQSRQGYSIRQPVSGIFILLLLLSCFGGGL